MRVFYIKLNFKYKKIMILLRRTKNIGDDFIVYFLTHTRKAEKNLIERKYIGICSTLEKAEEKVQEYVKYEGFERFPNGFKIKKLLLTNFVIFLKFIKMKMRDKFFWTHLIKNFFFP